jgi:hypothetical protein
MLVPSRVNQRFDRKKKENKTKLSKDCFWSTYEELVCGLKFSPGASIDDQRYGNGQALKVG